MADNQNTCDKCHRPFPSLTLIWITSEDFKPFKGEKIPRNAYEMYDALCEPCYKSILLH